MSSYPCLRICGGEADAQPMHELPKPIIVTSDYVLKEIFFDRVTVKGFLESLLVGENKLFPIGTKIEKIEFDRNEQAQRGELLSEKNPGQQTQRMFIDIKIRSKTEIYIIEMQKKLGRDDKGFFKRAQFYSTAAHSSQRVAGLKENGDSYEENCRNCRPVITISIVGAAEKAFPAGVPCVSYHKILETTTSKSFLGELSFVFIELSKVCANMGLDASVREWLGLLTRSDFEEAPRYKDQFVQRAADVVKGIRDQAWDAYMADYQEELIQMRVINSLEEAAEAAQQREAAAQQALCRAIRMMSPTGENLADIAGELKLPLSDVHRMLQESAGLAEVTTTRRMRSRQSRHKPTLQQRPCQALNSKNGTEPARQRREPKSQGHKKRRLAPGRV